MTAMTDAPSPPSATAARVGVLIVGAGFSGLATALECEAAGLDWRIVEAHDAAGGTWALNTYPGAACDVPSHLYHLARRPHAGWSRAYAPAAEIAAYAARVAAEPALTGRIAYRTRMARAAWGDGAWRVTLDGPNGEREIAARHEAVAHGKLVERVIVEELQAVGEHVNQHQREGGHEGGDEHGTSTWAVRPT